MRVLHRVPPLLREQNKQAYNPSVVSLGPYHHGQPQFRELEESKAELVSIMLKADHRRHLFRTNILARIEDIRHFYGGLSRDEYDDEALAEMMLRDACVVLYLVEMIAANEESHEEKSMFLFRQLGKFHWYVMAVDVYKLENQIPWWLINTLIKSAYDGDKKEEGEALMLRFLSFQTLGDFTKLKQFPWYLVRDEYLPLHLLEAIRITNLVNPEDPKINNLLHFDRYEEERAIIANETENTTTTIKCCKWWRRKSYAAAAGSFFQPGKRPFRSVTELKAKGIHFKPSSDFLLDIRFDSYYFFGVLHLPVLAVSKGAGIIFSNMVALEMSPGTPCADTMMTSYLALMKSMIEDSKDVKALQEKGIIVSFVGESEEIVRIFNEIDSYGLENLQVFDVIKMRINDHCNSKAKTWIAELINTNFHSPWTAIALLAAAFLLCLTFLQTYYTMNTRKT
ncbi:hypothetical protein C2S53_019737 [Perilla frutescens var. hirtella]|uniref:Uncharacterized protein n=1 Tax=Perilla frutescens var. hirtella TaxID=608512 RepID=A0AAD4P4M6_PERFH|nr:hypothetical protein C2S53_019737 [Perilla frutescens var. hirtella]